MFLLVTKRSLSARLSLCSCDNLVVLKLQIALSNNDPYHYRSKKISDVANFKQFLEGSRKSRSRSYLVQGHPPHGKWQQVLINMTEVVMTMIMNAMHTMVITIGNWKKIFRMYREVVGSRHSLTIHQVLYTIYKISCLSRLFFRSA